MARSFEWKKKSSYLNIPMRQKCKLYLNFNHVHSKSKQWDAGKIVQAQGKAVDCDDVLHRINLHEAYVHTTERKKTHEVVLLGKVVATVWERQWLFARPHGYRDARCLIRSIHIWCMKRWIGAITVTHLCFYKVSDKGKHAKQSDDLSPYECIIQKIIQ